ncbi:MAG: recombinase family protein [Erysipelotrichaceae bacterium]|nr:recombinase family protein [Erysipelotrichaceae bacterium]
MATWGYIRVSSRDQNEERQIAEIAPLVTTESHLIMEKQSGKDFDRPLWKSLKNIMREGDTLIIKSLDRLGRNYEQIKEEWQDLARRRIKVNVLDSPLLNTDKYEDDLMSSFASNIVFEVLSFVAENERRSIAQRQKEGVALARSRGVKFGRPKLEKPSNWDSIISEWKDGKITARKAMELTGVQRSTFYKMVKDDSRK